MAARWRQESSSPGGVAHHLPGLQEEKQQVQNTLAADERLASEPIAFPDPADLPPLMVSICRAAGVPVDAIREVVTPLWPDNPTDLGETQNAYWARRLSPHIARALASGRLTVEGIGRYCYRAISDPQGFTRKRTKDGQEAATVTAGDIVRRRDGGA